MTATSLTDEDLQKLYAWVDSIPLSRPKKNINRDFSDGVLAAEVISYYFPRLVDLHNYSAANSTQQKLYNWNTLNTKVLKKLKYQQAPSALEDLIHGKPGLVELFLHNLQYKMAKYKAAKEESATLSQPPSQYRSAGVAGSTYSNNFSDEEGSPSPSSPSRVNPIKRYPPSQVGPSPVGPKSGERRHHHQQPGSGGRSTSRGRGDGRRAGQGGGGGSGGGLQGRSGRDSLQQEVDEEILLEKEETIQELRETVEILEMKMAKLEQLVRLKDNRIQRLQEELARLQGHQPSDVGGRASC